MNIDLPMCLIIAVMFLGVFVGRHEHDPEGFNLAMLIFTRLLVMSVIMIGLGLFVGLWLASPQ